MATNLEGTNCVFCGTPVRLVEHPRPITRQDMRSDGYWAEFGEAVVAHAECPLCLAPYLAFCGGFHTPSYRDRAGVVRVEREAINVGQDCLFTWMNHRHAFGDEPLEEDLPKRRQLTMTVEVVIEPQHTWGEVTVRVGGRVGVGTSLAGALGDVLAGAES